MPNREELSPNLAAFITGIGIGDERRICVSPVARYLFYGDLRSSHQGERYQVDNSIEISR
jgi:hypothetical protein